MTLNEHIVETRDSSSKGDLDSVAADGFQPSLLLLYIHQLTKNFLGDLGQRIDCGKETSQFDKFLLDFRANTFVKQYKKLLVSRVTVSDALEYLETSIMSVALYLKSRPFKVYLPANLLLRVFAKIYFLGLAV